MKPMLERTNAYVSGMYENWMKRRTYTPSEDVEEFFDIPYLEDGEDCHRMDLYRPKIRTGNLPVIANFHGGGMMMCGKEFNRPFCAELAKRGFLVLCMDFPLVPQTDVPGILRDLCRGLNTVEAMVEDYGGDREKFYLVGDSAGGFLAVYLAAVQRGAEIAKAAGVTPPRMPIRGLGLFSGMFHTAERDGTGIFLRSAYYGKDWKRHPLLPYLKPEQEAVASLMPPCFLVTARADTLRRSTLRFYKGLQNARIPCELLDFSWNPRLTHDFAVMSPDTPQAQQALDAMTAFLLKNH